APRWRRPRRWCRAPRRRRTPPRRPCDRRSRDRARLVADPTNGEYDLRVLRVLLDLGAETLDVDVDQPGVRGVPVAPDVLEADLTGAHLPRLARELHQQVELQRRQGDRRPGTGHGVGGHVDGDVADVQQFARLVVATAEPGPDTGDELLGLE